MSLDRVVHYKRESDARDRAYMRSLVFRHASQIIIDPQSQTPNALITVSGTSRILIREELGKIKVDVYQGYEDE